MLGRLGSGGCALAIVLAGISVAAAGPPTIERAVDPLQATVGDPLELTLTLELPEDVSFEPPRLGPQLGRFAVIGGSWIGPETIVDGMRWQWIGQLAAYETGVLELPPIKVRLEGAATGESLVTEPLSITIESVLDPTEIEQSEVAIADLKPPASLEPDYGPLRTALVILGVLTAGALLAWWLHRRYGARLAAAEVPEDPFHRTPPHVWVYAELQQLLERRLPEQGQVELFYSELARILKLYLGGRFRVDLMERTTDEVPPSLRQAGAPAASIDEARKLLTDCDRVKFAQATPGPAEWKAGVEEVYRIVDRTKPVESARQPAATGAA